MRQPGYIRAQVQKAEGVTKVEWAHDSAWRFMPVAHDPACGYVLHPVDLAINKVLALAGREEPRDFIDVLHLNRVVLSLGALCWAAAGKDPGFTPLSLLDLLRRRGRHRKEDFERLHMAVALDLPALKSEWLEALAAADRFVRSCPPDDVGCLYYAHGKKAFVDPLQHGWADVVRHFGRPGGVLPRSVEAE